MVDVNEWLSEFDSDRVRDVLKRLEPNINDLQARSIRDFAALTARGGTVDIVVRRNGKDHTFEADWLPWLFR